MAYKRKWEKGEPIKSIGELATRMDLGELIMFNDRPTNPAVIENFRFGTVRSAVRRGILWAAKRVKET